MSTRTVPVAWMVKSSHSGDEIETELFQQSFDAAEFAERNGGIVIELYAATPPQPEPADHLADPDSRERAKNALRAIINAGSIGQAKRIAMQALGEDAATQDHTVSFRTADLPHKKPSTIIGGHPDDRSGFLPSNVAAKGSAEGAPERDAKPGIAEAGSRAAAPDGILCQARGDWGCNHTGTCASVNNAPPDAPTAPISSAEAYAMDCEGYAAPTTMNLGERADSKLPLSAEEINAMKGLLGANTLCDQALHAIELERHLKAQAEWGVNQFDRAEKAEALVAEKDKEIALLLAESVLDKERTKKVEAELTELKARVK